MIKSVNWTDFSCITSWSMGLVPIYIHRKKERKGERKLDFRRATFNTHNYKGLLGSCKTHELVYDGGEMTTVWHW